MKINKNYYLKVKKEYENILQEVEMVGTHLIELQKIVNSNNTEPLKEEFTKEYINNDVELINFIKNIREIDKLTTKLYNNFPKFIDILNYICYSEPLSYLLDKKYISLLNKYDNSEIGTNLSNFILDVSTGQLDIDSIEMLNIRLKEIIEANNK